MPIEDPHEIAIAPTCYRSPNPETPKMHFKVPKNAILDPREIWLESIKMPKMPIQTC